MPVENLKQLLRKLFQRRNRQSYPTTLHNQLTSEKHTKIGITKRKTWNLWFLLSYIRIQDFFELESFLRRVNWKGNDLNSKTLENVVRITFPIIILYIKLLNFSIDFEKKKGKKKNFFRHRKNGAKKERREREREREFVEPKLIKQKQTGVKSTKDFFFKIKSPIPTTSIKLRKENSNASRISISRNNLFLPRSKSFLPRRVKKKKICLARFSHIISFRFTFRAKL